MSDKTTAATSASYAEQAKALCANLTEAEQKMLCEKLEAACAASLPGMTEMTMSRMGAAQAYHTNSGFDKV